MRSAPVPLGEQLLRADREEVEVREPERRRDDETEQRGHDDAGVRDRCSAAPRPIAIRDSPIAMITISPWRSTKCAGASRQPLDADEERSEEADRERGDPECRS